MLILTESQAKNYYNKLHSFCNIEGCGCCSSNIHYEIKNRRILQISSGYRQGYSYFNVTVIAKIKKVRSN